MRFLCFLRGDNGTCDARGAALFLSGGNSSNPNTHPTALCDIPPNEHPDLFNTARVDSRIFPQISYQTWKQWLCFV